MTENVNKWLGYFSRDITIETKKRLLLRTACSFWFFTILVVTIERVVTATSDFQLDLIVNFMTCLVIFSIFMISLKGKDKLANFLFPSTLLISLILTAFFLFPGRDIELFLVIIAPASILFIGRKFIVNILFGMALCSFWFLPHLLDIHTYIHDLFYFKVIFIVIFLIIKDLDVINRQTEEILDTQKLKAEKDTRLIEMQKKELEELNDFKNKFFVNVSHELRTPITIIDGFSSQIIAKKLEDPVPMLEKIKGQANNMKQIVDQILDLSKMKLNKFKLNLIETCLSEMLQRLYTSFSPLFAEKSIDFELNVPEDMSVIADALYLERAINNIVLNSLKYTEKGKVTLSVTQDDYMAYLKVSDTGIGIKEAELGKVFQEFFQCDNEFNLSGGSGIGLSFSKNILELHGGTIEVESIYGRGADFTLSIPLDLGEQVKKEVATSTISAPMKNQEVLVENRKKATILIVEDHVEMMRYLNVFLSGDYNVIESQNGLEAMALLENKKVDFILTDYMMPKMNGGDFIKTIREKGYTTPVIVLTARTDVDTKLDVLRLGVDDYLYKPFNSEELLIKIKNRLINHKETEQPFKQTEGKTTLLETSPFISDLTSFVDQNCQKSIFNLDSICFHFGISESSLFRRLKTETGLNPQAFIREIRLLKARRMLENKDVRLLKELIGETGVKNMSYFKKIYFERFGIHIKDYIKARNSK